MVSSIGLAMFGNNACLFCVIVIAPKDAYLVLCIILDLQRCVRTAYYRSLHGAEYLMTDVYQKFRTQTFNSKSRPYCPRYKQCFPFSSFSYSVIYFNENSLLRSIIFLVLHQSIGQHVPDDPTASIKSTSGDRLNYRVKLSRQRYGTTVAPSCHCFSAKKTYHMCHHNSLFTNPIASKTDAFSLT